MLFSRKDPKRFCRVRAPPLPPYSTPSYQALTVLFRTAPAASSHFRHSQPGSLRKNLFFNGMKKTIQVPSEKRPEKHKSRFRLELSFHNNRVIMTDARDKGRYVNYVISYYLEGKRKQVRRATLAAAKREANLILTKLAQNEPDVRSLTGTDRLLYGQ